MCACRCDERPGIMGGFVIMRACPTRRPTLNRISSAWMPVPSSCVGHVLAHGAAGLVQGAYLVVSGDRGDSFRLSVMKARARRESSQGARAPTACATPKQLGS